VVFVQLSICHGFATVGVCVAYFVVVWVGESGGVFGTAVCVGVGVSVGVRGGRRFVRGVCPVGWVGSDV